jgi:hypothetical protein
MKSAPKPISSYRFVIESPAVPFPQPYATAYHLKRPVRGREDNGVGETNDKMLTQRKRSGRAWLSYGLFALSAVLFAAVIYMYVDHRNEEKTPPPPSAQAGGNEMKDVLSALKDQGLTVDYGRSADRAIGLTQVAQAIVINGETGYVFIYPDPQQRQTDQDRVDANSLTIVNTRSTPVATDPPQLYGGSNVIVAIYSTEADVQKKVQTAVEGLP